MCLGDLTFRQDVTKYTCEPGGIFEINNKPTLFNIKI